MTPTERLREMLDERGVAWVAWDDCTTAWGTRDDQHVATEDIMGTLQMTGVTPEGAIAATLGRETCYDTEEDPVRLTCSACGSVEGETLPRYCPSCGRRVVWMATALDLRVIQPVDSLHPSDAVVCKKCGMAYRVVKLDVDDGYLISEDEFECVPNYCPCCGTEVVK